MIGEGTQRNSESVLIYAGISVRTVETKLGFEVGEPTTLVLANYLFKDFFCNSLRGGKETFQLTDKTHDSQMQNDPL